MGLFDFLFKRRETKGFAPSAQPLAGLFTGRMVLGKKGHNVIPEDNSAVVASLRWVARNYPKAPMIVQRLNGSAYETIADHPALALLRKPCAGMPGRVLGQAIALSLVLDGNAYLYRVRDGNGKLAELQYLMHGCVNPVAGKDTPISYYEYRAGGSTYRLEPQDIIHIRDGVDPTNPALGWSGLKSVVNEILSDQEASDYTYAVLRNLGITGLVVSPVGDDFITEDQAELLKKRLLQDTTGDQRGEPLVLSQPVTVSSPGFSPEQMALDKIRSIPESRICAVIGIPAMVLDLVSGAERRTYSNYEEARSAALEDWLIPLYQLIDDTLTWELLPEFGGSGDERITRDLTQISALQEDANSLAQRAVNLYTGGIFTRAKALRLLGEQAGPEDEIYYLDAQAAGLSTDQAKSAVKADILAKRAYREAA